MQIIIMTPAQIQRAIPAPKGPKRRNVVSVYLIVLLRNPRSVLHVTLVPWQAKHGRVPCMGSLESSARYR